MKRVAIVGIPGAGKSTFALNLGKKLGIKVVHLDKELYGTNWKKRYSDKDWIKWQKKIVQLERWIIEGNYKSTLDIRLGAADTVIFVDSPKWLSIFRAASRALNDIGPITGLRQQFTLRLLKVILTYPREQILAKIKAFSPKKKVYILRNRSEIEQFLRMI